ncbi:MAG TPA: Holliday junction resolvase RuvX [Nitrospiraceae bacterium]|nr:Holliday junction resolvase RuvX [Nitrospiraceae bacterium]
MAGTRILALDPGSKRIGVALSDELGWIAQPLETYERQSVDRDVAHIHQLVRQHDVGKVVMGLPLQLDGRMGAQAEGVQRLIETLQRTLNVPVIAWDERLTTKAAEQMLIEADVSRKKRKGAVDRVAAALLLQSYLESCSSSGEAPGEGRPDGQAPADVAGHQTSKGV